MNGKRDNKEMDELVSKAYHELANERAPERLNQEILRTAAKQRSRTIGLHPLFAPWMKPVAWAATIGLSLIVVLELNQIPENTRPLEIMPASLSVDLPRNETQEEEAAVTDDAEEWARAMTRPMPEAILEQAIADKPARMLRPEPTAPLAEEAFSTSRMKIFVRASEKKESVAPDACAGALRDTRKKWLDCIDELRELGFMEEADREYTAFLLKYRAE